MTLELPLSPDFESRLRAQAALSGQDISAYVLQAVSEKLAESVPCDNEAPQQMDVWRENLQKLIELHPVANHFVDDSRESIYAGRGE